MSTNTSLPGGGGSSSSGGVNPVGITGRVGVTGTIGITGIVGITGAYFNPANTFYFGDQPSLAVAVDPNSFINVTGSVSTSGLVPATVTGSGSALNAVILGPVTATNYRSFNCRVTATGDMSITFQSSQDGVTWTSLNVYQYKSPTQIPAAAWSLINGSDATWFVSLKQAKVRVVITGWASGTASATATFYPSETDSGYIRYVDLASMAGGALSVGQKAMANSIPVVVASDQSALGVTGYVGATIGNFPSLYGVTGMLGVSVSNTNFGVTGALGVSISNTGLGVTFPTGIGVTFQQLSAQGVTGFVGLTGTQFVTLGSTLGKTAIFKTAVLTSLGTSAAQNILSYTVTGGKNFFLQAYNFETRFSTLVILSGSTNLGFAMLQSPAGTTLTIHTFWGDNSGDIDRSGFNFAEPIPFAQSSVINMCVSPNVSLSVTWIGNLIGYER